MIGCTLIGTSAHRPYGSGPAAAGTEATIGGEPPPSLGGKSGLGPRPSEGIIGAVGFPLEAFGPAVEERASTWAALELCQRMRPVHPNHGKPVTGVEFESSIWLVEVTIWSSGEAEVSTVRLTDDCVVNKHYELADRNDLDGLLDELVQLLVDDKVPPAAFVFQWPGVPS